MAESTRLFVLLLHTLPDGHHWDLMLDRGGDTLATWQLLGDPHGLAHPGGPVSLPARQIEDHRRAYLDYEGPVSRGRGHVRRIDRGMCTILEQQANSWVVHLAGTVLNGVFRFTTDLAKGDEWLLRRSEHYELSE